MFDYANVLDDSVGIHYPVHEIPSRVKLSCCTWNSYMKSNLIVSDYEGTVTLHDVAAGAEVRTNCAWSRAGICLACFAHFVNLHLSWAAAKTLTAETWVVLP